jgi:ADP-ribosylation factor protein 1
VDSNDRDRVVEARDELHRMLNEVKHSSGSLNYAAASINDIFFGQVDFAYITE